MLPNIPPFHVHWIEEVVSVKLYLNIPIPFFNPSTLPCGIPLSHTRVIYTQVAPLAFGLTPPKPSPSPLATIGAGVPDMFIRAFTPNLASFSYLSDLGHLNLL